MPYLKRLTMLYGPIGTVIATLKSPMKFLTFLPILALSLARASAIGITLDQATLTSTANGVLSIQTIFSPPSFFLSHLQGPGGRPLATASWHFANTSTEAILEEDFFLSNTGNTVPGSDTSAFGTIYFTLSEAVNYSLNGTLEMGTQGGWTYLNLGLGLPGVVYNSTLITTVPGVFHPAPLIGTLGPGSYFVGTTNGAQYGAEAIGEVFLRLTALTPNTGSPVPDAGSTMTLMGMALCTLGGIARRVKA